MFREFWYLIYIKSSHNCFLRVYKLGRLTSYSSGILVISISKHENHVDSAMQHKYRNYTEAFQYCRGTVQQLSKTFKRKKKTFSNNF